MAFEELHESGLLSEVNRLFFHPFGLELLPVGDEENFVVVDSRATGGVLLDEASLVHGKESFKRYLHTRAIGDMQTRAKKYGFTVQDATPPEESEEQEEGGA